MGDESNSDGQLERTLGLVGASTIGLGTMVGAGIFVFPGMAAGKAGMAATVSFALGALVALLVALPTAELATAMPRSGGGYFYISRGLGARIGALVGISLWWGLIFASAFYLVGFGHYFGDLVERIGWSHARGSTMLAVVAGVVLITINLVGTEKAGKFQNVIVGILLAVLCGFLGLGLLEITGGSPSTSESFAPYGAVPVLTTSSLIFTSYLGFAQVANVAGEVKNPARNLPVAMIGSVVLVGILYMLTIIVATSVYPSETLGQFGETAMIEVAERVLGMPGAIAILGAGLLATLSSANASLLSSSRAVYALGRDALLPRKASSLNQRFGTPHFSILGAGIPIVGLAMLGKVEFLAEVASFLHLVMYAFICVTVIVLRREDPDWYQPTFRAPGRSVVPAIGAIGSLAVVAFMHIEAIIAGCVIAAASAAWYFFYANEVELKGEFE